MDGISRDRMTSRGTTHSVYKFERGDVSEPRSRLERDVEDLLIRIRILENIAPQRLVEELRALDRRVQQMDTEGTRVTQIQLQDVKEDIVDMKAALLRQETEKRADRRVVLGALLAAATAIGLVIVQLVIQVFRR
jgi:hypothetical protein